jgi:predicted dehydrogenase
MSELSIAIIGAGAAGHVHLQCWRNMSGIRIAAVCDTDALEAAKMAGEVTGTAAFKDVSTMLRSERFDIVDVCVPASVQLEVCRAALNAGAHVLCESPFTANADAADTLVRLAELKERLLAPVFCHRTHPPVLFAKELLDQDEIGRPTMFRCRFSGYWDEASSDERARTQGALRSTAIHGIDLFRYFCGNIASVSGQLATANPDLKVEDTAALLLRAESGAIGVVETSWSSPGGRSVLEIYGSAGAVIVDYDTGALRYLTADHPVWRHHDEGGPNRFERLIASFADSVRGLQKPAANAEDGAAAADICDKVYAQAKGQA